MKINQYGPRMEELKREGETYREIAADVGRHMNIAVFDTNSENRGRIRNCITK